MVVVCAGNGNFQAVKGNDYVVDFAGYYAGDSSKVLMHEIFNLLYHPSNR